MASADQRRAPRIAAACNVEIDDRFGAWSAVTEDVGLRGCRIVSARAPRLGALVQLTLRSERLAAPLRMAGQAVWARDGRVGIAFVGTLAGAVTPAVWLRELAAALEDAPAAQPARPGPPRPVPAPVEATRTEPGPAGTAPPMIPLGAGSERPSPAPPARASGSGR